MALTKGKYQRLSIDLEKSEYKELLVLTRSRGCTIVFFVREAIKEAMQHKTSSIQYPRLRTS